MAICRIVGPDLYCFHSKNVEDNMETAMLTADPIARLRAQLIRRERWYFAPYRLVRWLRRWAS
jgi:hypothetical protein